MVRKCTAVVGLMGGDQRRKKSYVERSNHRKAEEGRLVDMSISVHDLKCYLSCRKTNQNKTKGEIKKLKSVRFMKPVM